MPSKYLILFACLLASLAFCKAELGIVEKQIQDFGNIDLNDLIEINEDIISELKKNLLSRVEILENYESEMQQILNKKHLDSFIRPAQKRATINPIRRFKPQNKQIRRSYS